MGRVKLCLFLSDLISNTSLINSFDFYRLQYNFATMSTVADAIKIMLGSFHKYAGEKEHLIKSDLAELLKVELLGGKEVKGAEMDEFFGELDEDSDGKVDFQEFVTYVATLAILTEQKK
ncbi:protein S100-A6-like [Pholidichthys leucotaenia]